MIGRINVLDFSLFTIAIFLPLWPSYIFLKMPGIPHINPTRYLIFQGLLLWGLALLSNAYYRDRFTRVLKENKLIIFYLMVPFFIWKILTACTSNYSQISLYGAIRDLLYCFGLFLMTATIIESTDKTEKLMKVILYASLVVFLVTFYEAATKQNLFGSFVNKSYISINRFQAGLYRDGNFRVMGTFSHPIALAGYCSIIIPLGLWYFNYRKDKLRLIGLVSCTLITISLFLSTSRAGLVTVVFMATGYFLIHFLPGFFSQIYSRRKRIYSIILIGCVAVAFTLGALVYVENLAKGRSEKESGSSSVRIMQIEKGFPLVKSKPVLGYGPNQAATVLGLKARTVDNYYLTLALESGFPALLLFLSIYFGFLLVARKCYLEKFTLSGLSISIFWIIAGNALFLSVVSLEQTLPYIFILFGLLVSMKSNVNTTSNRYR